MWRQRVRRLTSWKIRPGGADDEVGADVGQLVQLDVGDVGGEGVVDGAGAAGLGHVLDDHVRVAQPPGVFAVVALGVGGHLALAFGPEGDRPW